MNLWWYIEQEYVHVGSIVVILEVGGGDVLVPCLFILAWIHLHILLHNSILGLSQYSSLLSSQDEI